MTNLSKIRANLSIFIEWGGKFDKINRFMLDLPPKGHVKLTKYVNTKGKEIRE